MKVNALKKKLYMDPVRSTNSIEQERNRHRTSVSSKHTDNHIQLIDNVKLSADTSLRFAQDHLESEIGKQLEEVFGEYGMDLDDAVSMDWSEEATAQRIFDFSTGLFEVWRTQCPEMSEEELIDSFEQTIRPAVDEGYSQAVDILSSLEFDDSVLETAEETMSILHKNYDDYFADLRAQLEE